MGESILYGNSISLKIIAGSLWNRISWSELQISLILNFTCYAAKFSLLFATPDYKIVLYLTCKAAICNCIDMV